MDDQAQPGEPEREQEPEQGEGPLTPLHPNHVKALRVGAFLLVLPFLIGSLVVEVSRLLPPAAIAGPVWVLAGWMVIGLPWRRYKARGYRMGADRLQVVRGLLFHKDTIVPFGRVQHIDVEKGPVERYYSLATLVLHTAGTHNASVTLPGLAEEDALAMREAIRAKIRRDTL
ncbi:MAG TPA: PH domain-containing protein [Alteraurantiacibacter sp.]